MGRMILWCLVSFIMTVNSQSVSQDLEDYIEVGKKTVNQRYRLKYHVAAPVGWINDPNGFSYYKGQFHLFYQYYPYASVWGDMHWGHVVSKDLVNWEQLKTALIPNNEQCFSGSAVEDDKNQMVLMYTAHEVNQSVVKQSQYLAYSTDGVTFTKYEKNPVIAESPDASPDFRDPKVWKHEDYWYVVLGTKTTYNQGSLLLYRSTNLIDWEYLNVLITASSSSNIYMLECPDFFELGGRHILLLSPQGMQSQGDRYKNTFQTGYVIGTFNYTTFEFTAEVDFQEIDFGHDFYAAQTTEVNGTRYLISWFSMWGVPHPEDVDGWSGAMTVVRELTLQGDRILQNPVKSMENIRASAVKANSLQPNTEVTFGQAVELLVSASWNKNVELLLVGNRGGGRVLLRWDSKVRKVQVDRGNDDVRQVEWSPATGHTWRVFLDSSSLELFCGIGDVVFSSRVYPDGGWKLKNLSPQTITVNSYDLKTSVPTISAASQPATMGYLLVMSLLSYLHRF